MATFNSPARCKVICGFIAAIFLLSAGIALADDAQNKIFASRAESEFLRAQKQFQSETNDFTSAWQFARACFDWADFSTNNSQREIIAKLGIAASQRAIALSNSAAGNYYLGMNNGQLARAEFVGALRLVHEMEREFSAAAKVDATFDHAGPERSLGLLYRDAPGWPISIGSESKARDFLERALKLAPDFPENHLNLIESNIQWHEMSDAKKGLETLDLLWAKAQKDFSGEIWERDWTDWTARRDAARKKLEDSSHSSK